MGLYGHHKSVTQSTSLVPCSDMAGTIITSHTPLFRPGDRVLSIFNQTHQSGQIQLSDMASGLGLPLPGVLAQYRVFPAHGLVRCPDYLSDEEACTLPIAAVTAWTSLNWMRPLGHPVEEGTVLLQGTGGVSVAGLQIAHALGLRTIVTSSSDEKLARARELGADCGINYRTRPDWDAEVLRFTEERGADVILETGGAMTLRRSFECVAFGGLISCIGYLSGKEDAEGERLNTNVLALKRNVTLKGILNGGKDRFEEMLGFYEDKGIRPVVDRVFAFGEAREALRYLFTGGHFGKVVIRIE